MNSNAINRINASRIWLSLINSNSRTCIGSVPMPIKRFGYFETVSAKLSFNIWHRSSECSGLAYNIIFKILALKKIRQYEEWQVYN